MKSGYSAQFSIAFWLLFLMLVPAVLSAQDTGAEKQKSDFWKKVDFGGGIGLSFGNRFTNISIAPAAIYNFNDTFAAGVGLQGSYIKVRNEYDAYIYGGSLLSLVNVIPQIQLSAELEQVRVNTNYEIETAPDFEDNFWNTALFIGAGYRANNITVGLRYNVLHSDGQRIYRDPWMPFVRVFF